MLKLGGLHLDDLPRDVKEAVDDFGYRIRQIVIKRDDDGYHYSLEVHYDEEGLDAERALRLLKEDPETIRKIEETQNVVLNSEKFQKLRELFEEIARTTVELTNEVALKTKSFDEATRLSILTPTLAQLLDFFAQLFGEDALKKALEKAKLMRSLV